jgi:hypothetical protein
MRTWTIAIAGWFLLAGLSLVGVAQMEPDAPVRNFILPRFDEAGNRIWSLRGRTGTYVNSDQIDVEGMQLKVFKKGEPDQLDIQIESPKASIHTGENRATGPGTIVVLGSTFALSGQNWEWKGENDKIIVKENARVAFSENLSDILR